MRVVCFVLGVPHLFYFDIVLFVFVFCFLFFNFIGIYLLCREPGGGRIFILFLKSPRFGLGLIHIPFLFDNACFESFFIGIYLLCREPGDAFSLLFYYCNSYKYLWSYYGMRDPHLTLPSRPAPKFSLYPLSKYINIFMENLDNAVFHGPPLQYPHPRSPPR